MIAVASASLSGLDIAAWAGLPVACVPLGSPLEPLTVGQRLLVASDGLYIEAANDALYLRLLLAPARTPWGEVTPTAALRHGPIPTHFAQQLADLSLAAHPREMAALIVADASEPTGYRLIRPGHTATHASVTYADDGYPESSLVIDAHSHGHYDAIFSSTDDASDRSRLTPHISLVFGRCANSDGMVLSGRACIGHYLLPLDDSLLAGLFA